MTSSRAGYLTHPKKSRSDSFLRFVVGMLRVTFMSHIFDSYCLTIDSSCSAYNICTIALNCHPKKHVLEFIFASPPPLTHGRIFQGMFYTMRNVSILLFYTKTFILAVNLILPYIINFLATSELHSLYFGHAVFLEKNEKLANIADACNGNFCHSNSYLP